jgi:hypothetical protein
MEFTKSYVKGMEGTFGLVNISGVKIIGSFDSSRGLTEGSQVKMTRCGITPVGTPYYYFEPI